MSSERVSVVIRAGGRARGTARRAASDRPSGADRVDAGTIRRADRDSDDGYPRWLLEVDMDLRDLNLDPDYWLRNCHGFLVDSESGEEIGVVDDVELEPGSDRAVALVVASGWFGRRLRRISVGEVRAIVPSEERLVVTDLEAPRDA